jgi:hypothetical protein
MAQSSASWLVDGGRSAVDRIAGAHPAMQQTRLATIAHRTAVTKVTIAR